MSLDICSHCRQLVGCQIPNFFSRIAGRSPRVAAANRKLFAIVSATVSTAGLAMLVSPSLARFRCRLWQPVFFETGAEFSSNSLLTLRSSPPNRRSHMLNARTGSARTCSAKTFNAKTCNSKIFNAKSSLPPKTLAPRLLLFPAPFAPRTLFLGAEIEFLDVLGIHQPLAGIVHHDPADFQHITIMRGLQRHLGVLLDQQDRHALLLVDALDDSSSASTRSRACRS